MTAARVALLETEELDLGLDAFDESHGGGTGVGALWGGVEAFGWGRE